MKINIIHINKKLGGGGEGSSISFKSVKRSWDQKVREQLINTYSLPLYTGRLITYPTLDQGPLSWGPEGVLEFTLTFHRTSRRWCIVSPRAKVMDLIIFSISHQALLSVNSGNMSSLNFAQPLWHPESQAWKSLGPRYWEWGIYFNQLNIELIYLFFLCRIPCQELEARKGQSE